MRTDEQVHADFVSASSEECKRTYVAELVSRHIGYLKHYASQQVRRLGLEQDDFDDLLGELVRVACQCVHSWQPAQGPYPLWVRTQFPNALIRFRLMREAAHLTQGELKLETAIRAVQRRWYREGRPEPTAEQVWEELADYKGLSSARRPPLDAVQRHLHPTRNLPLVYEDGEERGAFAREGRDTSSRLDLLAALRAAQLNELEQALLHRRVLAPEGDSTQLKELAQEFGLGRETLRLREQRLMSKLAHPVVLRHLT